MDTLDQSSIGVLGGGLDLEDTNLDINKVSNHRLSISSNSTYTSWDILGQLSAIGISCAIHNPDGFSLRLGVVNIQLAQLDSIFQTPIIHWRYRTVRTLHNLQQMTKAISSLRKNLYK